MSKNLLVGRVGELRQYPVKSVLGHRVGRLDVAHTHVLGDHVLGVVNQAGQLLTAKQSAGVRLLTVAAWAYPIDGALSYWIKVPDPFYQEGWYDDSFVVDALSKLLGFPIEFIHVGAETEPIQTISGFSVGPDSFVDECDLHLVTSASVQYVEQQARTTDLVRRMRPQLVIETTNWIPALAELGWIGRRLLVGEQVVLRIDEATKRCAMPGRPQFGLPAAPGLLTWLRVNLDNRFGISASVEQPGAVMQGDRITLV